MLYMNDYDLIDEDYSNYYGDELDNVPVTECTDEDPFNSLLRVACEGEIGYNKIVNVMAMDELAYFNGGNNELIWETVGEAYDKVKEVFKKAIEWIKTQWSKFMGVIQSVLRKIDEWNVLDKQFLKRHSEKLKKVNGDTIKYEGYDYAGLKDAPDKITDLSSRIKKNMTMNSILDCDVDEDIVNKYDDNKDDYWDDIYKYLCDGDSSADRSNFREHFKQYIQGTKFKTIKVDSNKIIKELEHNGIMKADIKRSYTTAKNFFKECTGNIKKMNKWSERKGKDSDYKKLLSSFVKDGLHITHTGISVAHLMENELLKGLAKRNRMNKAIAIKVIKEHKEPKKNTTNDKVSPDQQEIIKQYYDWKKMNESYSFDGSINDIEF